MDVKFMRGNSNYQFVSTDSVGNSCGILCVWEATVFKKDYATVLDNFIAIYGTWIPCNSKVLIVVIYAPQQPSHKSKGVERREDHNTHMDVGNFILEVDGKFRSIEIGDGRQTAVMRLGMEWKIVVMVICRAASMIGCVVMQKPFRYLRVKVCDCIPRKTAWVDTVHKLRSRLSNWKVKTLSIRGRLTLLKSVLSASPLYNMSIYKVPKGVLKEMEAIRSKFFNGADISDRKITWAAWDKVLASKKNGGLGVSSFHALNRALLLKWVWRFISQDGSLWFRVIQALYGSSFDFHSVNQLSIWCSILREVHLLKSKGFDFFTHCKKRVGDGHSNSFSGMIWKCLIKPLRDKVSVAWMCVMGAEAHHGLNLNSLSGFVSLRPLRIEWICDLTGDWICRWWELDWYDLASFLDWYAVILQLAFSSSLKLLLEGVFYVAWWHLWVFMNRSIFDAAPPRRLVIFDDI
ncbi:hypothetical protein Tco_1320821, partial [Tanacetum coccineum]